MNVIKNEKGTFVELPRESITFCGSTEEEKKANELIFDLSLENDRQQQELERYKNIIDEALGIANERINYYAHKQIEAEDWSEIFNVLIKRDNQELKGSDN